MTEPAWEGIFNLDDEWPSLLYEDLTALAQVWREQKARLETTRAYQTFLVEMRRRIAIETGIIERLYTIDRGITQMLIQRGIDEALIPHGTTDKSPAEIVPLIRDQAQAIDYIFDYAASQRELTTSFIKQLHQFLTRHQPFTEAVDQFGNIGQVELLRGDWKKFPNNPRRNGITHVYCPPEQVAGQMDQLLLWHQQHMAERVNPAVEAAWLHHRFTQIHPFQDGNGRVARLLASLVFIRAGWFPLVITRDDRDQYIHALEAADDGWLVPLIDLFNEAQKQAFIQSLSLSEQLLTEGAAVKTMLEAIASRVQGYQQVKQEQAQQTAATAAAQLLQRAETRLNALKLEIQRIVKETVVSLVITGPEDDHAGWYYRQIVETARSLNYYANLHHHKSWLRLIIRLNAADPRPVFLLLSFHGLGKDVARGIMVCSAFAMQKLVDTDLTVDEETAGYATEPLTDSAFQFTYLEDYATIEQRFDRWLEQVIRLGLAYWYKRL
ncbi:MAG: Fic family protein [Anaerolineae bacterium]|nr:Fic family protein [Anaerolineae bacterium]